MTVCKICGSKELTSNGNPGNHKEKTHQLYCKICHSYFYKNEKLNYIPKESYPPTSIPFPIIASQLEFFKVVKNNSEKTLQELCDHTNMLLVYYQIRDKGCGISRETVRQWIKKYSHLIDDKELMKQVEDDLDKMEKKLYGDHKDKDDDKYVFPEEVWKTKKVRNKKSHTEALMIAQKCFGGRENALKWAKKDGEFFKRIIKNCKYESVMYRDYKYDNH
jgi:hypothetical protein